MQVEPGMFGEPRLHVRVFVGGVVVQNHVNRNAFGHLLVYGAHESQELFVAMPVWSLQEPITVPSRAPRAANNVVMPCLS